MLSRAGTDGTFAYSGLVFDEPRNLYGTTAGVGGVGPCDMGSIPGLWRSGKTDASLQRPVEGDSPFSARMAARAAGFSGAWYWMRRATFKISVLRCTAPPVKIAPLAAGTVFKLTPGTGDQWTATTLYEF